MTNLQARPTIYNGVQMRSRLEAGFAAWLDRWDVNWTYEPQVFANATGQYLPDFKIDRIRVLGCDSTLYVEVKPGTFNVRNEEEWLTSREDIIRTSHKNAHFVVAVGPEGSRPSELHIMVYGTVRRALWVLEGRQAQVPKVDWGTHGGHTSLEELRMAIARQELEQAMAPWEPSLAVGMHPLVPWHGEWWKGSAP